MHGACTAGLKVARARQLHASLQPGGEIFNRLLFSSRLVPVLDFFADVFAVLHGFAIFSLLMVL